jgi:hypothetical protein
VPLLRRKPAPEGIGPFPGVTPSASFTPLAIVAPWQAAGGGGYGRRVNIPLSQFPARWEGVQLHNGVDGLRSAWFWPVAVLPQNTLPVIRNTQRPVNVPGAQRFGSVYGGALGIIGTARMREAVTEAQIRQSGLQATDWGAALVAKFS